MVLVFAVVFVVCCYLLYRYLIDSVERIAEARAKRIAEQESMDSGLYIDNGDIYQLISNNPDASLISRTVMQNDWSVISFVMLVTESNSMIEVSGSSNPEDGFSASYRAGNVGLFAKNAPETINQLAEILCAFHRDEVGALEKYEFA